MKLSVLQDLVVTYRKMNDLNHFKYSLILTPLISMSGNTFIYKDLFRHLN